MGWNEHPKPNSCHQEKDEQILINFYQIFDKIKRYSKELDLS